VVCESHQYRRFGPGDPAEPIDERRRGVGRGADRLKHALVTRSRCSKAHEKRSGDARPLESRKRRGSSQRFEDKSSGRGQRTVEIPDAECPSVLGIEASEDRLSTPNGINEIAGFACRSVKRLRGTRGTRFCGRENEE
jgi:hypothetical protein